MRELLFVCNMGWYRSPTGADVFTTLLVRDGFDNYHASSAGLLNEKEPLDGIRVTEAYGVFACDYFVYTGMKRRFPGVEVKMRGFQIPDVFDKGDPKLVAFFTAYYQTGEWKSPLRQTVSFEIPVQLGP